MMLLDLTSFAGLSASFNSADHCQVYAGFFCSVTCWISVCVQYCIFWIGRLEFELEICSAVALIKLGFDTAVWSIYQCWHSATFGLYECMASCRICSDISTKEKSDGINCACARGDLGCSCVASLTSMNNQVRWSWLFLRCESYKYE